MVYCSVLVCDEGTYFAYEFSGYAIKKVKDVENLMDKLKLFPKRDFNERGVKMMIYTPEYTYRTMGTGKEPISYGELLVVDIGSTLFPSGKAYADGLRAIAEKATREEFSPATHPIDDGNDNDNDDSS